MLSEKGKASLPDNLDPGRTDFSIARNQRYPQVGSSGGNQPVRHVWNCFTRDSLDLQRCAHIERSDFKTGFGIRKGLNKAS
jgi:hypothetical protein